MTSTSITTVGGLVVVTQVIPQDEKAIPLQAPADASTQAPPPVKPAPPTPSPKDDMTTTFLKREPQGLGIVQIFIGLLCVIFSVTAVLSPILLLHAPFCLGVFFVVSGSLAVAAAKRTSVTMIRVCLAWNVISTLIGVAGLVYLSFLLADRPPSVRMCETCNGRLWMLDVTVFGLLGLLMVLLTLHVCVAITVCVFSGRALRRQNNYVLTVMVDSGKTPLLTAASLSDSDVALLDN